MSLDQVTLAVGDLARSVEFYRRLGFAQIVADEGYARFVCPAGDETLSLEQIDTVPPSATTVFLECDELDETVSGLEARASPSSTLRSTSLGCGVRPAYAIQTAIGCAYSTPERTASIYPGGFPADGFTARPVGGGAGRRCSTSIK